jgi:hypothetical protein
MLNASSERTAADLQGEPLGLENYFVVGQLADDRRHVGRRDLDQVTIVKTRSFLLWPSILNDFISYA